MGAGVTRVVLPDGTPVWARITQVEEVTGERASPPGGYAPPGEPAPPAGGYADAAPADAAPRHRVPPPFPDATSRYSDTGFRDRVTAQMDSLRGLISGVAGSLAEGLRDARPDEVTVSFGIELAGSTGKVVGLLAEGSASSTLNVTLTWRGGPPDDAGSGA